MPSGKTINRRCIICDGPMRRSSNPTCSYRCGGAFRRGRLHQRRAAVFVPLTIHGQAAVVWLNSRHYSIIDSQDWESVAPYAWRPLTIVSRRGGCYAVTTIGRRVVGMHNLILPTPEGVEPDHRDRNPLNNRRSNLRPATRSQQMFNAERVNSTGFRGVSRNGRSGFRATIRVDGKTAENSCHRTAEAAARAYDAMALRHHGEFATLNFADGK